MKFIQAVTESIAVFSQFYHLCDSRNTFELNQFSLIVQKWIQGQKE